MREGILKDKIVLEMREKLDEKGRREVVKKKKMGSEGVESKGGEEMKGEKRIVEEKRKWLVKRCLVKKVMIEIMERKKREIEGNRKKIGK